SRILAEAAQKAKAFKPRVVIPKKTWAQGKQLLALVAKSDLCGAPARGWGYRVLMQSNAAYPDAGDLLSRKAYEYPGPPPLGGRSGYTCGPRVHGRLVSPGPGRGDGRQKPRPVLGSYKCTPQASGWKLAVVPMVYPGT